MQENCSCLSVEKKNLFQCLKQKQMIKYNQLIKEEILGASDVQLKCKQMAPLSNLLTALHVTGRTNGGWKLLMWLQGGEAGL